MTFPALMTAMATPFDASGGLDLPGAQALAAHLVDHGSGGLVVAGTTGESPTLSTSETLDLCRAVVEAVGSRAMVLAGTGKNDTAATVAMTERVSDTGVDGIMLVAPYYNRPNQGGLHAHFAAAAGATDKPVMLYNIPSRTAVEVTPQTLLDLATEVDNILAVKDAVGDMAKASWLASRAPEGFQILSGDDKNCLPLLAVGGSGLVSVAAHLVGDDLAEMIRLFPTDPAAARSLHHRLLPVFDALFIEPSPAPLKAALGWLGLPGGPLRLPLIPIGDDTAAQVADAMTAVGLHPTIEDS
ncbi:4-hydroxy-tetrahydrodipicolinate synthase [Euzebya tangerina]|uniref:4-hydroxy-tetrahydrodipicolinate synthase n=1 Tax=Euzebya tangerina TaxID=591198 RepID=UPI00196A2474|nr:4-hydroxy-tetrahydrodipicolinate synthase [Euzebya tangerina]